VSKGRDLFGKLAIVEALAEAEFTERGSWIDRCWRGRTARRTVGQSSLLSSLTVCGRYNALLRVD